MKALKKIILILKIYFISTTVFADVDVRTGGYKKSFLDFVILNSPVDVRMQREYSSRSAEKGWFGWGWCSNYELTLLVQDQNNIIFKSCNYETNFKVKYKNIWYSEDFLKGILVKKQDEFLLTLDEQTTHVFSVNGELKSIQYRNGKIIKFIRNKGFFSKTHSVLIEYSLNQSLELTFNLDNLVEKIVLKAPNGLEVLRDKSSLRPKVWTFYYYYADQNLIRITEENKNIFSYFYSSQRNLERAEVEGKTQIQIQYNESLDLVNKVVYSNGCNEDLKYYFNNNDPINKHQTQYKKYCNGKLVLFGNYNFEYKFDPLVGRYLANVKIEKEKGTKIFTFNPKSEQAIERFPSHIKKGGL
jgi:hypothetical protein